MNKVWLMLQSFSLHLLYFDIGKIRFQYTPKEYLGDGDENSWRCGKEEETAHIRRKETIEVSSPALLDCLPSNS